MKRIKLFSLLCLGLMLGSTSCSKDDDDENDNPRNNNGGTVTNNDDSAETAKYKFYGAELYSKETFKYGKFEAKMKMAYAPGCISSMFLYYNNSYMGKGEIWNEIDIEVIGKEPNGFQSNIITGSLENQVTTEQVHKLSSPVASDFHIYTVEWTPDYVAWYLDGQVIRKNDSTNDSKRQVAALVKEQSLRFNIWSSKSTAWVGTLSQKDIPIEQQIDYVKVYDYDEATASFTEKWTDEFDTFDFNRWSKGNWAMENVTERPNNVVVEDGILKLKLTKELK